MDLEKKIRELQDRDPFEVDVGEEILDYAITYGYPVDVVMKNYWQRQEEQPPEENYSQLRGEVSMLKKLRDLR